MAKLLRIASFAALTALAATASLAAPPKPDPAAAQWWADIAAIADDRNEGRQTGSPGYLRAADYVVTRFKALGLKPAGEQGGYLQNVAFTEQIIDHAASTAQLIDAQGKASPLSAGTDLLISAGGGPRPVAVDAPLVFIGYGLHLPAQGHDDLAGLDLKGKIAVVLSGGPAEIAAPIKASNRAERAKFLKDAGAVGLITLVTPAQVEIPWDRRKLLAGQAGMYLADSTLRDMPDGFFAASVDPARSDALFAGSSHSFAELTALADASAPLPCFELPVRLSATISATFRQVESPNLVGLLPGNDPRLRKEYLVVSAHLDHLGIGAPINGKAIYSGAMDDASGVASVLDIAHRLRTGNRPRRSVLFVIVTAEEKGLLGSQYFANRPTVAKDAIVADLNLDMPLPLWPLKTVVVQGEAESSLGTEARSTAKAQGLVVAPDPLPERNSFIRTDQFSFVRAGVPALAFKFGFAKGTPEFQIEHDWRANRYHAPSDDLDQPGVLKDEAVKLDRYIAAIARRITNAAPRPVWLDTSVFKPAAKAE
ncbi:M28 family metallopeptidase [Novosphingobium sp.]|uniref:M28 family metallopeptidase n=1 Tax=Novosphingobium sp. TaxID=1874826 RepID=UPI003BAD93E5